jgi:hypothetical protein
MKSGNLSLLEPLGPVQACNGIALPLPPPPPPSTSCPKIMTTVYLDLYVRSELFLFAMTHSEEGTGRRNFWAVTSHAEGPNEIKIRVSGL